MGIIAVVHHIFEMTVWLRLFKLDARYGLVYYSELLKTQRRYWRDFREQLNREVALLLRFEQKEREAESKGIQHIKSLSEDILGMFREEEIEKYEFLHKRLAAMLANEDTYSEAKWQEEILQR
jgi:hypothetical protein